MLLLLPSITFRIRIHVRRRGLSCAHTAEKGLDDTGWAAVNTTMPVATSDLGLMTLSIAEPLAMGTTKPRAHGLTGPLVLGAKKLSALKGGGRNAITNVGCYRDASVSLGYERKTSARLKTGNATFKTVSEVSLDQSAARGAFLRAFAPVAPEESSGRSANCSKSRRSSQLEKLRPSRAASVRAKASRSARNDTLVWVLPRARTPWRLFVLGVLTPHHPRNSGTPQYKNASK